MMRPAAGVIFACRVTGLPGQLAFAPVTACASSFGPQERMATTHMRFSELSVLRSGFGVCPLDSKSISDELIARFGLVATAARLKSSQAMSGKEAIRFSGLAIGLLFCHRASDASRFTKTKRAKRLCLALSFNLLLVYFGQPSALTSVSGSGLMAFTAGGNAVVPLGTR